MKGWRIGVDSGGTFTDICVVDQTEGTSLVWKVPSTPRDPSEAIARGIRIGIEAVGAVAEAISYLGHGTTVATNTLIQGAGAKTGLITTAGFRDLLEIARQQRPSLYDLQCDKPAPIIPRRRRMEVPERLRHDGRTETPLDEEAVRNAVAHLRAEGVVAVAVAFLYAYLNPHHERRARDIVAAALPEAFITCSHETAPEFREFERFSTVAVNASLGPVMSGYLRRVAARIHDLGVRAPAHITQSNGGVISFDLAARQPVRTVLSGPSTGVIAAVETGRQAGERDLITFDMGGTSTDVSLVRDGRPTHSSTRSVEGWPLLIPMLDIHTVGAGGGSIAHVDHGGLLKVGPKSAGADPGPACYGLGATEPTVTDANVVLGILNPRHLLAGRMEIDHELARGAISRLGALLGLSVEETAQGIVTVVTSNMAKAIRVISVQRGHDTRDFSLVAFGGAGPLHAARLARELETPRVILPPHPGVQCAVGLLLSDLAIDFARTRLLDLHGSGEAVPRTFSELEAHAAQWFEEERVPSTARRMRRSIDMRYAGQNYELPVAVPSAASPEELVAGLRRGFETEHRRLYGYIAPEEPVQLVTFRLQAVGVSPKTPALRVRSASTPVDAAICGWRHAYMPEFDEFVRCPVYERARLGAGHVLSGPAIIEQMDATALVLGGQRASVDPFGNIIIEESGS